MTNVHSCIKWDLFLYLDGPVLVHTTFGDLLRTLDAPSSFRGPENVTMSREGIVVVSYEKGNIAAFTMNGRRLRHQSHHDNINVYIINMFSNNSNRDRI